MGRRGVGCVCPLGDGRDVEKPGSSWSINTSCFLSILYPPLMRMSSEGDQGREAKDGR